MMLGLNQVALSKLSGIHQVHISRAERGQYRTMNLAMLVTLAQHLQTSIDYLLGLSEEPGVIPPLRCLGAMPVLAN
jgi:transcriptional regulator with XRE-family HTH domain